MGKFSWSQSHSRQSSETKPLFTSDWLHKSPTEPSCRALNELAKEQVDAEMGSSAAQSRMRSRSGTVSSIRSHYAKSSVDRSAEIRSRPQSRQSVMAETPPSPPRQEPISKGLFSKGSRIMRRKNSRLTLLPSQMEEAPAGSSHPESDGFKLDLATQLLNLSPKRANTIKPNISGPFGFQHVTHTDQGQFQSLNKASRTELVSEFSALQAGQQPAAKLQGIPVGDLPSSSRNEPRVDASQLPSPTHSIIPELPMTPPRPEPPPKDERPMALTTPNMRLSRSVENFSRPTRSPVFGGDVSPISEIPAQGEGLPPGSPLPSTPPSPLSWAEAINDTLSTIAGRGASIPPPHLLDKPLPLPPTLVHAVSTADNSALRLRTSPLPRLPTTPHSLADDTLTSSVLISNEQKPLSPHRSSLRHMQTFPSTKAARRRSQSSGEMTLGPVILGFRSMSPTDAPQPRSAKRSSIGIKKIDIDDWEDAIDYSWDHPLDIEYGTEAFQPSLLMADDGAASMRLVPGPHGSIPAHRPMPLPLTTVMEQSPRPNQYSEQDLSLSYAGRHEPTNKSIPLQGLGIAALRPTTVVHVDSDTGTEEHHVGESLRIATRRREPGSPMSKSSSQESIILSIASSIMGTHRSSNSSTSLSDMSHLASVEDERMMAQQNRSGSIEGNVSDSSQDTVTTEARSVSTPATELPSPQAPTPPQKHDRGPSISRIQVPDRTSSIVAAKSPPPAGRQRSSTLGGRPRNVRVSYSLFPTKASQPPTPPAGL